MCSWATSNWGSTSPGVRKVQGSGSRVRKGLDAGQAALCHVSALVETDDGGLLGGGLSRQVRSDTARAASDIQEGEAGGSGPEGKSSSQPSQLAQATLPPSPITATYEENEHPLTIHERDSGGTSAGVTRFGPRPGHFAVDPSVDRTTWNHSAKRAIHRRRNFVCNQVLWDGVPK